MAAVGAVGRRCSIRSGGPVEQGSNDYGDARAGQVRAVASLTVRQADAITVGPVRA